MFLATWEEEGSCERNFNLNNLAGHRRQPRVAYFSTERVTVRYPRTASVHTERVASVLRPKITYKVYAETMTPEGRRSVIEQRFSRVEIAAKSTRFWVRLR